MEGAAQGGIHRVWHLAPGHVPRDATIRIGVRDGLGKVVETGPTQAIFTDPKHPMLRMIRLGGESSGSAVKASALLSARRYLEQSEMKQAAVG